MIGSLRKIGSAATRKLFQTFGYQVRRDLAFDPAMEPEFREIARACLP